LRRLCRCPLKGKAAATCVKRQVTDAPSEALILSCFCLFLLTLPANTGMMISSEKAPAGAFAGI
jgi:hypothetical protein